MLAHSGARAVVCEDAAQLAKIERIRGECPALEHVDRPAGSHPDRRRGGVLADGCARARRRRRDGERRSPTASRSCTPNDPATIVYTSGTTGPPKGCVLTHANWLARSTCTPSVPPLGEQPIVFLFLPLAHSLARVAQLVALDIGGTLVFWRGDARAIMDDVALTRPTHLPLVRACWRRCTRACSIRSSRASALEQRAFGAALSLGRRRAAAQRRVDGRTPPRCSPRTRSRTASCSRACAKVFGDRLEQLLVGAAPVGPEVLAFFEACGIEVLEGYGLTETCAAATLNVPGATRLGTAGRPLPGDEVADRAPTARSCCAAPNVFPGYYENELATREALDEAGWLRTGDLGALDDDGYLRITGRTKDLIITSSGKNVTPSNLEAALREIRWVSQAVAVRRPAPLPRRAADPRPRRAAGAR